MIRTVVMHLLPLLDNLINALENELCQCTSSQNIDGNYVAGKLMKLRPRFGEISEKSALRVLKPKIFTAFGLFQTVWRKTLKATDFMGHFNGRLVSKNDARTLKLFT